MHRELVHTGSMCHSMTKGCEGCMGIHSMQWPLPGRVRTLACVVPLVYAEHGHMLYAACIHVACWAGLL